MTDDPRRDHTVPPSPSASSQIPKYSPLKPKPPEGVTAELFAYLQASFASIASGVQDSVALSKQAIELGQANRAELVKVKWHVFGPQGLDLPSMPPPASVEPDSVASVLGRVATAEHDVDAARGRELVLAAKVATIENHIKAQSSAMGVVAPTVGPNGLEVVEDEDKGKSPTSAFLHSRAGRDFVIRIATLVLAAVTTIATTYLATRSPPPPVPAAPSHLLHTP